MHPWTAPSGILLYHPADHSLNLGTDRWPAGIPRPRSKTPEQTKTRSMPADNGFRFDNDQDVAPRRPKPAERNPEYPILGSEPGVWALHRDEAVEMRVTPLVDDAHAAFAEFHRDHVMVERLSDYGAGPPIPSVSDPCRNLLEGLRPL